MGTHRHMGQKLSHKHRTKHIVLRKRVRYEDSESTTQFVPVRITVNMVPNCQLHPGKRKSGSGKGVCEQRRWAAVNMEVDADGGGLGSKKSNFVIESGLDFADFGVPFVATVERCYKRRGGTFGEFHVSFVATVARCYKSRGGPGLFVRGTMEP